MRTIFGDCEFDSGRRVLLRHGHVVSLSPRAFQLLELLLDRRPEAVSKTDLLAQLWPQVFVSDASLHNLMAEIRAALGDNARAPRYIRTLPRFGYAFHGDAAAAPPPGVPMGAVARPGSYLTSKRGDWTLGEGENVVGRDRDCAVRIDSPTVSRRHARIVVTGGRATLEDLGSKNGTYVDGRRLTESVALGDGSQIRIGSAKMVYRFLEALPSTLTLRDS